MFPDYVRAARGLRSLLLCGLAFCPALAAGAERTAEGARPAPRLALAEPRLGDRTSEIVIVEFGDYQCPSCRRFALNQFEQIKRELIDRGFAQYVFKDFPLPQNRYAFSAAAAARCAHEQGRFWEMHRALYERQDAIGAQLYEQLARELGIDVEAFHLCLRSPKVAAGVRRNIQEGRRFGVNSTPTVMLGRIEGDRMIVLRVAGGAPDAAAIAEEVKRLRQEIASGQREQTSKP